MGALVRLALNHGAADNAIAVVISMLASLLAAPRGDVRARYGVAIRRRVCSALAAGLAGQGEVAPDDFELLSRMAASGGAGTSNDVVDRVLGALACLPGASREKIRTRHLDVAVAMAARALADAHAGPGAPPAR